MLLYVTLAVKAPVTPADTQELQVHSLALSGGKERREALEDKKKGGGLSCQLGAQLSPAFHWAAATCSDQLCRHKTAPLFPLLRSVMEEENFLSEKN